MMSAAILVEVVAKTSVVLLLAWGVTWAMARRGSAAARHFVWAVALAATVAVPGVVRFGPAWHVAGLPGTWMSPVDAVSNLSAAGTGARADGDVWPAIASPGSHAPATAESGRSRIVPGGRFLLSAATEWRNDWSTILVRVWALGFAVGVVYLAIGVLWAAWLTAGAATITAPEWVALQADAMALMKVSGRVRLLMSDRVGVPVACGIMRPALLLPADAASWDRERRLVVLLHELAHVKRRDCLVQAAAHLAWAMHWFNPLAFVAVSRLRAEQEGSCDDLVLSVGTPAAEYADHLCEIASNARRNLAPVWATLAIARRSRLESRVTAILDDTRSRRAPALRLWAAIAVLVCVSVLPLGVVRPAAATRAMAILPSVALDAIVPYSSLIPLPQPEYVPAPLVDVALEASALAVPAGVALPVQELTTESGGAFLQNCTRCHNSTLKTANLSLDKYDSGRVGDNQEIWEKVVRKLRSGLHPPTGVTRPDRVATDAFCASVEAALDRADQANWGPGVAEQLKDREIATRLAKFLWSSEPDDALLKVAAAGRLRNPSVLQQEIRRMIAEPRSTALMAGFFGDWLSLKNMSTLKRDPALFPDFDDTLREALGQETDLFLASQVREDHSLIELLTANYTFLNERLAQHYGIGKIAGSTFRRVTLTDDSRYGLLGQGSLLSVTSYANRTSPVLRGKFVREVFLGAPTPPPPPNVPALKEDDPEHPKSVRARMEEHAKNAICSSCHSAIDPFGFALENFDAIGRWRDSDAGLTIDASGTLADGSTFEGPAQLRAALLDRRDVVASTMTLKLLAYALGRPARYSDTPAVRAILRETAVDNFKWSSTIAAIVKSAPFKMKRLDE
jgi:beta-lactamase regulating signal transducer with metallopeptidase domain